jgi:hypothetical protein
MKLCIDVVTGWGVGMTVFLVGAGFFYALKAFKLPMDV